MIFTFHTKFTWGSHPSTEPVVASKVIQPVKQPSVRESLIVPMSSKTALQNYKIREVTSGKELKAQFVELGIQVLEDDLSPKGFEAKSHNWKLA